ncbi:DUF4336 domain-containing protein [Argonema galeatum]|uniref:DUF4336 domain-containing protein n=1 Tax=Argonema galeatum TaxID=2942762 RepID=UPI002013AF56|nr:DUF4336 domain-containing protein [Argonema galeatum]MCL1467504.1 DUF4336 domain-containing protein [Argonema galeatum A003/A1]
MKAHQTQEQEVCPSIDPGDLSWPFWPAVPLYPYGRRRTLCHEVVKDKIWTFDQLQGILYVVAPIRMTVVKLEEGGLFVYAPVAPTPECVRLVKELEAMHGDVKYIILPTVSGIEHKVFVGPFARRFPLAQVFVAPSQWSFPLNLPLSWLGLPAKRTQILPSDSSLAPFADRFDYAMLGPIDLGLGPFEEVAFFDKLTRTLLVTDSVVSVPEEPPAIVQLDPYPLLFHAKDDAFDVVEDSEATRHKGWQRISLFAFYFRPSALEVVEMGQSFRDALKGPDRSRKAYFGWFPFKWKNEWKQSFDALRGGGRLFVAPILQTLILNRAPKQAIDWANKVASWDFDRIIPCHFDSPIFANQRQFRQAFAFLEKNPSVADGLFGNSTQFLPQSDFKLLKELEVILNKMGVTPPAKEKV